MRITYCLGLLCVALIAGCARPQSASYHYAQKQIEQGDISFHRSIRVNEYLNAFPQDWFKVGEGQEIALRVDPLTAKTVRPGETTLYQIAVKTRMPSTQEQRAPLALSFVIDVSGSMNDDRKIIDTKEALRKSISELKDGDVVSLVKFDSSAQVVASNVVLSDATRTSLIGQVEALRAVGGTNIEDGLVLGYREMARFPATHIKRLILLTDGQSNVGTITPDEIAKEAAVQRVEGARISTIGLGHDVNEALLRQIAIAGKGQYYFAENAQSLTDTLREGLLTTVIPVAKDVTLDIELGEEFVFERIHGAEPKEGVGRRSARVSLGELNVNDWRILVLELKRVSGAGTSGAIHVHGRYTPLAAAGPGASLPIPELRDTAGGSGKINPFVLRNAVLYGNASALIRAGRLSELRLYEDALHVLDVQINNNDVLAAIDNSAMAKKERDNLVKVRSLIAARVAGGSVQAAPATPEAEPVAGGDNDRIRRMVAAGLKSSAVALPGLWTTIAMVLAAAIE
jgi:Ca-activated chloride channel family protein